MPFLLEPSCPVVITLDTRASICAHSGIPTPVPERPFVGSGRHHRLRDDGDRYAWIASRLIRRAWIRQITRVSRLLFLQLLETRRFDSGVVLLRYEASAP